MHIFELDESERGVANGYGGGGARVYEGGVVRLREVWQGLRGRCGKGYEGGVARVTREVWQGL